jgi:hypothetical protein
MHVGRTAKDVIEALSGHHFAEGEGVYTSRKYFFKGSLKNEYLYGEGDRRIATD